MSEKKSREELALTVAEAEWQWLKPHMGRLVTVAAAIDLAEAGERIAADDTLQVSTWVERGIIGKPTAAEIGRWDLTPAKMFLMLVVSPYVLIQEIGTMN